MKPEAWHRRHAIQITAALPDDLEDALMVLDLARELVAGFLAGKTPQASDLDRDRGNVVSLSSATSGSSR